MEKRSMEKRIDEKKGRRKKRFARNKERRVQFRTGVSRLLKPLGEDGRPSDWFSPKYCAQQYSALLEANEVPKRKRGERSESSEGVNELSKEELIVRKLTQERIEELKKQMRVERSKYRKLKQKIEQIESGDLDDQLDEMIADFEKKDAEAAALLEAKTKVEVQQVTEFKPELNKDFITNEPITDSIMKDEPMQISEPMKLNEPEVISTDENKNLSTNISQLDKNNTTNEEEQVNLDCSNELLVKKENSKETLIIPEKETLCKDVIVTEDEDDTLNTKDVDQPPDEILSPSKEDQDISEESTLVDNDQFMDITETSDANITQHAVVSVTDIPVVPGEEKTVIDVASTQDSSENLTKENITTTEDNTVTNINCGTQKKEPDEPLHEEIDVIQTEDNVKPLKDNIQIEPIQVKGDATKIDDFNKSDDQDNSEIDNHSKSLPSTPLPSNSSTLFESFPNSPALSNSSEMDHETAANYKAWRKSIMILWKQVASHRYASLFLQPVSDEIAPNYSHIVYRAMDLSTLKKNVENGMIRTTSEFQRDLMLMFQNALMYNNCEHDVYKMANEMQQDVMDQVAQFLATQLMVETNITSKGSTSKTLRKSTMRRTALSTEKDVDEENYISASTAVLLSVLVGEARSKRVAAIEGEAKFMRKKQPSNE